jgi:trigger factor
VRQFPGQEKQILEYFQKTPGAAASLRAPIFEEKVIDHLLARSR